MYKLQILIVDVNVIILGYFDFIYYFYTLFRQINFKI